MIEAAIRTTLLAAQAVSSVVASRVYLNRMPQGNESPAIVYQRISTTRHPHMQGPSGLVSAFIQIDCWSTDSTVARQLGEDVRKLLDGFDGPMAGHARVVCLLEDERDLSEPPEKDSEKTWFRSSLDFAVSYNEETQ